jgi:hypothetical protein
VAALRLGPLLRHVGADDATVWVKTDAPCEVEVLGHPCYRAVLEAEGDAGSIVREFAFASARRRPSARRARHRSWSA